ncbi:MAG: helix-turn-helix domain-containing protein [Pseudomonadota bacterium]|nr:helix-turn-helix domain-containing protein [Pseudomonadota bacterium]
MENAKRIGTPYAVSVENEFEPLHVCVERAIQRYLDDLGDFPPGEMYRMVLEEFERPLLKTVIKHTNGNQTTAADILGINRTTLRKKLRHYQLDNIS